MAVRGGVAMVPRVRVVLVRVLHRIASCRSGEASIMPRTARRRVAPGRREADAQHTSHV
jgi:hypothetical protein